MSFGLLRCGMAHSFQKDHHLNANLKMHRTQKAGPVIKPLPALICVSKLKNSLVSIAWYEVARPLSINLKVVDTSIALLDV
jgi:hypothetical protein